MMQVNRNGIMVDIPYLRKRRTKVIPKPQSDFTQYKTFATMQGFEKGCNVIVIVPVKHVDYKKLSRQGYKEIERWEKVENA